MIVTWHEEDVQDLGFLVKKRSDKELFIVGYSGAGEQRMYHITSLADGMVLNAGRLRDDLASYLTRYNYIPYVKLPTAQSIVGGR